MTPALPRTPLPRTPLPVTPPQALVARDLAGGYAGRRVVDGLDVVAAPGRVLAVTGENGSGKSTLLALLAGLLDPDAGTVEVPADLGHLPQEPDVPPGATVGSVLADAVAPLLALAARVELLASRLDTDPAAATSYAVALEQARTSDAWDAERRATVTAARLGLAALAPDRPVSTLSGGERSRLALAALLTRRPACLVLDEPTNHLDDAAVAHVEQVLTDLPGVVVVASHDRVFLDRVADQVLDLDAGPLGSDGRGGRTHGLADGGYTAVLRARAAARSREEDLHAREQAELSALRRAVSTTARQVAHGRPPRDNDKFVHHAKGQEVERTVSRRVRDAERRLRTLEAEQVPAPPVRLSFTGALAPGAGGAVRARDLVVPGRLALPSLDVVPGGHLLVSGRNGTGKSTLLAVLAARSRAAVPPGTTGRLRIEARRVGHLPQHVGTRAEGRTAREVYAAAVADLPDRPVALRDLGLVRAADLDRPVRELSLGQQRRLALAVLVARTPTWRCSTSRPTTSRSPSATSSRRRCTPPRGPSWSPATTGGSAPGGRGRTSSSVDPAVLSPCAW